MSNRQIHYDVVVVGGGPAGMAAAWAASQHSDSVVLVERSPWLGGQIWRHDAPQHAPFACKRWLRRIEASTVDVRIQTAIIGADQPHSLLAEDPQGALEISYQKLILAVGARELFVPFPGWTLPNIFGVGAMHIAAKLDWPVRGKKIAVAGSGPLLFAAAAHLRRYGAKIVLMAEQADLSSLVNFGMHLPLLAPSKIAQAGLYQSMLLGVSYKTHCWALEALGDERVREVKFTNQKMTWTVACDYLACAFGLVGNLELPALLGCNIDRNTVTVDTYQQTTITDVYCSGEPTGIAGVDGSLVEGLIAGYTAAGQKSIAEKFFSKRDRSQRFAETLDHAFALRPELKELAADDTIVCRCEDVTLGQIRNNTSWRAAKLYHHTGMGACQGRTCGAAVQFMFGWETTSFRPPLFPADIETIATKPENSEILSISQE